MRIANRRSVLLLVLALALLPVLVACGGETERQGNTGAPCSSGIDAPDAAGPHALALAKAAGLDRWGQVHKMRYTFAVARNGEQLVERMWTWVPDSGRVELEQPDGSQLSWQHPLAEGAGEELHEADQSFINDNYWLLFPIRTAWCVRAGDCMLADAGEQPLPIGGGSAPSLVATWRGEVGYTPGDVYELWLDDQGRIAQWNFRKAGGEDGRAFVWSEYRELGPLTIALDHQTADGSFRVYFPAVEVWLADGTHESAGLD